MCHKIKKEKGERGSIVISGLSDFSLEDTLECGQCFRHKLIKKDGEYAEYMIPIKNRVFTVAQRRRGEIIFLGASDGDVELLVSYFGLSQDYEKIKDEIRNNTDSEWLHSAINTAGGIRILSQDPWEALFSFIVSQNNNIPRIKKIISEICREYGVNLCLQNGIKKCPLSIIDTTPCDENCQKCGFCYNFPSPDAVLENPEKLMPSKPGFRYKYLLDAAAKVALGEVNIEEILKRGEYEYTVGELTKILGVGNKVASCTALFGFGNLEAFPVDVWMKRAIDEYFSGRLDPKSLGRYAGVAQQFIFHYIRIINSAQKEITQ